MKINIVRVQTATTPDKVQSADATVILMKNGEIVNGSSDVLKGVSSDLGVGILGFMNLGK